MFNVASFFSLHLVNLIREYTHFIFYKDTAYKNIEAEICRKIKNMLRIFPASLSSNPFIV